MEKKKIGEDARSENQFLRFALGVSVFVNVAWVCGMMLFVYRVFG